MSFFNSIISLLYNKKSSTISQPYVQFEGTEAFTLYANFVIDSIDNATTVPHWDGKVEYSFNGSEWVEWDGSLIDSTTRLYLRGTGNTRFATGTTTYTQLVFNTNGLILTTGRIDNLLDYKTVALGGEPTMSNYCFRRFFYQCNNILTSAELPATTVTPYCYHGMFHACTSLLQAPELPATTLASYCYQYMFNNCSSLINAPELPATAMKTYCYYYMFHDCVSLKQPPNLPATTLASYCYNSMFYGCSSMKVSDIEIEDAIIWRIPSSGTIGSTATNWSQYMLIDTGGVFTSAPSINTTYYLDVSEPEPEPDPNTLKIEGTEAFTLSATYHRWDGTVEYSFNGYDWFEWENGEVLGETTTLYLRGINNTTFATDTTTGSYTNFVFNTTGSISVSGNLATILDYQTVADGGDCTMKIYCFNGLFENCTSLVTAPDLPATKLSQYCYRCLFQGCTSLITAPELPATTLTVGCYRSMFQGCTSLINPPELPALTIPNYGYNHMFQSCTSLINPPELPATIINNFGYRYMFTNCSSLKVSKTQDTEYSYPWPLPSSGTISSTGTSWCEYMLTNTGGTYTATPTKNTTYYLDV